MEIIYRAFDGTEFDNEADCCHHEHTINEGVKMWNREGKEITNGDTRPGFVVYLANVEANLAFHRMAEACGDEDVQSIVKGEDYGLYYWDECVNEYRWVDEEEMMVLFKAIEYIRNRKED